MNILPTHAEPTDAGPQATSCGPRLAFQYLSLSQSPSSLVSTPLLHYLCFLSLSCFQLVFSLSCLSPNAELPHGLFCWLYLCTINSGIRMLAPMFLYTAMSLTPCHPESPSTILFLYIHSSYVFPSNACSAYPYTFLALSSFPVTPSEIILFQLHNTHGMPSNTNQIRTVITLTYHPVCDRSVPPISSRWYMTSHICAVHPGYNTDA